MGVGGRREACFSEKGAPDLGASPTVSASREKISCFRIRFETTPRKKREEESEFVVNINKVRRIGQALSFKETSGCNVSTVILSLTGRTNN